MGFRSKLRVLDKKMQTWRVNIYSLNSLLALLAIATCFTSVCSLGVLLYQAGINDHCRTGTRFKILIALLWTCLIIFPFCWSGFILAYCRRRTRFESDYRRASYNHNIYQIKKSCAQVLTMSFFTYLDYYLDANNLLWTRLMCVAFYLHLVFMMMILRMREDFDVCFGFLAASFGMCYEASETVTEKLFLGLVTLLLCSFKNYMIGGKSTGVLRVLRVRRPSKASRLLMASETLLPSGNDFENTLCDYRTSIYLMDNLLVGCAMVTFLASYGTFGIIIFKDSEDITSYSVPFKLVLLCWTVYIPIYGHQKRNDPGDEKKEPVYFNIYMLLKSFGQVVTLGLFTYLDKYLLAEDKILAVIIVTGFYLHVLFAMVLFRANEDYDFASSCLAAAFGVSYNHTKGWGTFGLVIVTVILCCLKNYLVGGRGVKYTTNAGSLLQGQNKRNAPDERKPITHSSKKKKA